MKVKTILLFAGLAVGANAAQAFNMFNPGDWFDNDRDHHDRYYDRGYYGGYGPYGWGGPWGVPMAVTALTAGVAATRRP